MKEKGSISRGDLVMHVRGPDSAFPFPVDLDKPHIPYGATGTCVHPLGKYPGRIGAVELGEVYGYVVDFGGVYSESLTPFGFLVKIAGPDIRLEGEESTEQGMPAIASR